VSAEIVLTDWQATDLLNGRFVDAVDSDERPVTVYLPVFTPHPTAAGYPVLALTPDDLELAESPEGLVCGAVGGSAGWTVRVQS
jgi:hypothetical protein